MTTEPNPPQEASDKVTEKPANLPADGTASVDSAAITTPPVPVPAATPTAPAPVAEVDPAISAARALKVDAVLLLLLVVLTFLVGSFAATNTDLWMELAIGKRLSEGQLTFGVDPFSWATEATATRPAPYWVHQGWLSSWLFYQIDQINGSALVVLKAFLFALAIAILSMITWNGTSRWFGLICLTMTALAVSQRLLLQPVVFSYLFLAITVFLLARSGFFAQPTPAAREAVRTRCLWYLPPLFAVWANLDQWFILGPILVGLCWIATGLMLRFSPHPSAVPGKTLGLVFGAGLAACLLNPHHVRVFQLPPELAYVLLSLQLPLPDAIGGGGRTLYQLHQAKLASFWTVSSVSKDYWQNPGVGMNISGISVYPLFVLGVAAFALTGFAKSQPGSPTLHLGRFLPWVVFALLAASLYRLIPFFAIVAAPLAAMTLGEFLQWQQTQAGVTAARRDRGLQLARWVSLPFMLLLLYLAWPGWLHGTTEFNSERRVAWHIRPSSSLKQAATTLEGLKKNGECGNVFNIGFDTASYCSWFAPDVKCFMDTRFALFADHVGDYIKARQVLMSERRLNEKTFDWRLWFAENKINQVVLTSFLDPKTIFRMTATNNFLDQASLNWWGDADHWRERFGDNRAMVFSWAGPEKQWPAGTVVNDWNRRGFGEIPRQQRPPVNGTMPPQQASLWDLYSQGVGPQPQIVGEAQLLRVRYESEHQMSQDYRFYGWLLMCGTLSTSQGTPGGGQIIPSFASLWHMLSITRPGDYGPPALPLLMVRAARLAVAENPQDAASQMILKDAYEMLRKYQEDYWIGYVAYKDGPPHPSRLRDRLRQIQMIAALYNISLLQPERPEPHLLLAALYDSHWLLDASLEHMKLAVVALEARKSSLKNPQDLKEFDNYISQQQENIKNRERNLQQRQAKLKEFAGGKSAVDLAEYAFGGKYVDTVRGQERETPLGLGNKSLEILAGIKSSSPEEEVRRQRLMLDLSISMGHIEAAVTILKQPAFEKILSPSMLAQYQVLVGGVIGDYDTMNKALEVLEQTVQERAGFHHGVYFASLQGIPGMQPSSSYLTQLWFQSFHHTPQMAEQYNDLYNTATLRGIVALEAGQTKKAQTIFRTILDKAGEHQFFSERRIVERYLALLDSQLPKK